MSVSSESDITKPTLGKLESNESVLIKTMRMTINLITNILIFLTVFVSVLYTIRCNNITAFEVHIMLCVLGYQLFMCQGVLLLSKFNSWSMNLSRRSKKHLHIWFQLLGFIFAVVGSSIILCREKHHFNSMHGILGITALIITSISILNGITATYAHKLSRSYTFLIKFIHYSFGIFTLLISAAALSTGFEEITFRVWLKNDAAVVGLICITWIFTFLVAIDFWLSTGQKLCNLL